MLPLLLILALAIAAPEPPERVLRGLAVAIEVPELVTPSDRAADAHGVLTCTAADERGDTEVVYGALLRVRFVRPGAPEAGQRGARTVAEPVVTTQDVATRVVDGLVRRGWTPDPVLAAGSQELRWRFHRDDAEVTVRRILVRDDAWDLEVRSQLDPTTVCPAWPPDEAWDELRELETRLTAQGTAWRWPESERRGAVVSLRRWRTTEGTTLDGLVELVRYGAALVPAGASLEDALLAGAHADRQSLLPDDHRAVWGTADDRPRFRLSGCLHGLAEATRSGNPFSTAPYPAALEDDPGFPLTARGPEQPKSLVAALAVAPDGRVTEARVVSRPALESRRHRSAWDAFLTCTVEVLEGLRYPPGGEPRTGELVLHSDRSGIRLPPR